MPNPIPLLKKCLANDFFQGNILLLLLLGAFFWQPLFTGQSLLGTDLIFQLDPLWQPLAPADFTHPQNHALSDQLSLYYPWKHFTYQAFEQHSLPLWNPYVNGGHPLIGNSESAIFEPTHLISYLFPLGYSFVVVAFLRLWIAGFSMLLLATEIGLSKLGSWMAMISFTFSGVMICFLHYPIPGVFMWLPAVFFLTEKILIRQQLGYAIPLSFVWAGQFLAGHSPTSFHLILVGLIYALFRMSYCQGNRLRGGVAFVISLFWGILLSAMQLVPAIVTILNSEALASRSAPVSQPWLEMLFPVRNWLGLITTVLPDYFGNPVFDNFWYPGPENYVTLNGYSGFLPLVLALTLTIVGLRYGFNDFSPHGPFIKFFIALALISLGIAYRLPLFNLADELPGLNIVNNGRLRLVYVFSIALLAGYAVDILSQRLQSRIPPENHARFLRTFLTTVGGLSLLSGLAILLSYTALRLFEHSILELGHAQVQLVQGNPFFSKPLEAYHALVETRYQQMLANFHLSNGRIYLPIYLGGIIWVIIKLFPQQVQATRLLSKLLISLTLFDLFLMGYLFNPTTPSAHVFPTPELIHFLKQEDDSPHRLVGLDLALYPNSAMIFGLQDIRGYDLMSPRRYMSLVSKLEGNFRGIHLSLFTQATSPLFDLLNVKYAISQKPLGEKWTPIYSTDNDLTLYRNPTVWPRAYLVHQAIFAANEEQSLAKLLEPSFDFRHSVILEGTAQPDTTQMENRSPLTESVTITAYRPNQVDLHVQAAAAGYLVLSDSYAPGWQAYVDGRPTDILVANHAFRAISLPAGVHQVTFVYRPWDFKLGVGLTLLGLFISLIVIGLRVRQW